MLEGSGAVYRRAEARRKRAESAALKRAAADAATVAADEVSVAASVDARNGAADAVKPLLRLLPLLRQTETL